MKNDCCHHCGCQPAPLREIAEAVLQPEDGVTRLHVPSMLRLAQGYLELEEAATRHTLAERWAGAPFSARCDLVAILADLRRG